jgi:hypothetical protein
MSPRRLRRRARRRSRAQPLILVGAAAVVLLLLIGGLAEVSHQSAGYNANSNRSLAALGGVVAEQSDTTSAQIRSLIANLSTQIRQTLQADLDNAVSAANAEASRAELASGSAAPGSIPANFAAVFEDRANAVNDLRSAVYGYLGMNPAQVAGAPADAPPPASPALISATDATTRIVAAGTLLAQADRLYASVRSTLAAAPGHAHLPRSVWVTDPQAWHAGAVATEVDLMATSSSLEATHYLVLRTIRLSPSPLPTPQATPAGTSVLSPTTGLTVTVVVANEGTVDEPRATVRFALANSKSGVTTSHVERAAVESGASLTLPDASFVVAPGTTYVLTVSLALPAGQTDTLGTATQQTLEIAPAT